MVAGTGTNTQSDWHASATGKLVIRPTRYSRMSTASTALIRPSPDTSHAICWSASSVMRPTAAPRATTASPAVTAVPASPRFCGWMLQLSPATAFSVNCPAASVTILAGAWPCSATVTPETGASLPWWRICPLIESESDTACTRGPDSKSSAAAKHVASAPRLPLVLSSIPCMLRGTERQISFRQSSPAPLPDPEAERQVRGTRNHIW